MIDIESQEIQLTFNNKKGILHLESKLFPGVGFSSRFEILGEQNGKTVQLIQKNTIFQALPEEITGQESQTYQLAVVPTIAKTRVELTIKLPLDKNFALFQFRISNLGEKPISINKISFLDILPGDLNLGIFNEEQLPFFYSNGWQSWSYTRTYQLGEKQRFSKLGRLQNPMVLNPGTPRPRKCNQFSGDMFGVVGDHGTEVGLLAGFLSQKSHFGSLLTQFHPQPSLKMWANGDHAELLPGKTITTDWAAVSFIDLVEPEPMAPYFNAVAREHNIQWNHPSPTGWCSWYHFYQNINQEVIESNLQSLVEIKDELPLTLCQIDDGFEKQVGDWYAFSKGFPDGVQNLATKISKRDLTPGIWLAPFILHPKADLVRSHPDWLLRDKKGKPVTAGFGWNAMTYALDLTNPSALAYTCDIIHEAVANWGYKYLKLDFLYASALEGCYQDSTKTRAQVLREGLEALRKAAGPDVIMLACGCPLGSALGLFEAMRISADVSGHWEPHLPVLGSMLKKEPGVPCARNALHNILTRAPLQHHWWVNDPDCLLVRPDSHLSLAEVQTLATVIGMTGGSLLLSDDLPALPEERLKIAQVLLPLIDQRAQVIDWTKGSHPAHLRVDLTGPFGPWHLLAIINWENNAKSISFSPNIFKLPEGNAWWLREFWTGEIGQMATETPFTFKDIPAHGVRVFAVRPYHSNQTAYIGSNLHLSQGMEISQWKVNQNQVDINFDLGRNASGNIYLYLPWKNPTAWIKGVKMPLNGFGQSIYQVYLENVNGTNLEIKGN